MDPKYHKTIHLFCIGASVGLLIASIFVKMGKVTNVAPEQWFYPFIVGIVFLVIEYLIQRKPK